MKIRQIKHSEDLLACNGGIQVQKLVNSLHTFQEVDKTLDRNTRTTETGSATHATRIDPDRFVEHCSLFCRHDSTLSYPSARCKTLRQNILDHVTRNAG